MNETTIWSSLDQTFIEWHYGCTFAQMEEVRYRYRYEYILIFVTEDLLQTGYDPNPYSGGATICPGTPSWENLWCFYELNTRTVVLSKHEPWICMKKMASGFTDKYEKLNFHYINHNK